MAACVLGKRARGAESSGVDDWSVAQRVKRRAKGTTRRKATTFVVSDENVDPDEGLRGCKDGVAVTQQDADAMEVDENQDPLQTTTSLKEKISVAPTERKVVGIARSILSPTKINGEARVSVSPQKPIQLPTPQTPRHRDALSKKVPITPRHRIGLLGKPALTPRTPRTPSTPGNHVTAVYHPARQLFTRSSDPGRRVGRDDERNELSTFLREAIQIKHAKRCMYVSGPPGTGKSALVGEVCRGYEEVEGVKMMYLNCMSVKSGAGLYAKLIEGLLGEQSVLEKSEEDTLKDLFTASTSSTAKSKCVVTLDEIDALLPISPEVLYTLFSLALAPRSRLILIGIANALDLTDRFLPRLKAKNLKPHLLPFLPYTAGQITEVITTKLQSLVPSPVEGGNAEGQSDGFIPFVHPTAIAFCSKKVASQTGDLRKAFDIVRKAIELVEAETKQKYTSIHQKHPQSPPSSRKSPLGENNNLASPPSSSHPSPTASAPLSSSTPSETLNPRTAPRATIAHLAKVTSSTLSQGPSERLKTLNLQQKAALCALLSLQQQSDNERDSTTTVFGAITPSSSIGRGKGLYGDSDDFIGSPFPINKNLYRNDDIFSSSPPTTPSTPSKRPSHNLAPTLRSLYTKYTTLCNRPSSSALTPLSSTEFADVVTGLETMGLVALAEARNHTTPMTTTGRGGRFVDRLQLTPLSCKGGRRKGAVGLGGAGSGNGRGGKEERRLVACVGRKDVEASLGEGVAGESLRGFFEG